MPSSSRGLKRRITTFAAVLSAALVVAACAANSSGQSELTTVRFGAPVGPSQGLDPHRSSVSQDHTFLGPLYDPLINETPSGELTPGLATEWEFNEKGDVLTLSLRDGVTFHDGAEFNAEAVKANIERGQTVEGSAIAPMLAVIDSVKVIDPLTVELRLTEPSATLPGMLADRAGMMISPDALDDENLANKPVGAGMFELVEYRPGDGARYQRFDNYWNPDDVRVDELEIVIQSSSVTRLNAMRNDELDIAVLDPPQFAEAESSELVTKQFDTTGLAGIMQLNRTRREFSDVRVRQALNHAIDREAIAKSVYLGYAHPSEQFYPEGFAWGHVPELVGRYPHDPDKARQLLADAGFADGFSFELIIPSTTELEQLGEVLQAQLDKVGITVKLRQVEATEAANIFYTEQNGDAVIGPYPGRTDPAITAQLYFGADSHSNPGGHVLDGMPEAYRAAMEPTSDDERAKRLHKVMEIAVERAGNVIVAQAKALVVTNPRVSGFTWSMRGQPDFRGVAISTD